MPELPPALSQATTTPGRVRVGKGEQRLRRSETISSSWGALTAGGRLFALIEKRLGKKNFR